MNNLNGRQKETLGIGFFLVISAVLLLVLALNIYLLVTVLSDGPSHNTDEPDKNDTITEEKDTDKPSVNVSVNTTPLFPTQESRENYISTTAANVVHITDEIKSRNTILVELDSNTSIVEKGADEKMYPSSMTKVMTLIVACENVTDLDKKLTVTQEAAQYMADTDGSGVGLKVGDSHTVEDLLYLISYQSDTIASLLIADYIAGSEEAFVALMNKKAYELGLTGTNFANCTGLYHDDHYTTCRDMAAIMAYAMDNEFAYKCLSSFYGRPMVVGGINCTFYSNWYSGQKRFDNNPNLKTSTVIAGKTGYTDESGITLVSVARGDNGKTYINVIVGLPKGSGLTESQSTNEVKYIYNTYVK